MSVITETDIVKACRTLFGNDVDITRDFLFYSVQPSGVKSAYRKKAKETHPDLFASDPLHVQQKQTALFREILRAYDVLNLFFDQREKGIWHPDLTTQRTQTKKQEPAHTKPAPSSPTPSSGDDIYYNGPMPNRTLQIGQYLYYRGKITFGSLIRALLWQRKQRPTIGDIAVQWGLLDREKVSKVFTLCTRPRLFGEKAVELGLMTVFQVNTILLYQRSRQNRLGMYFIQNNILSMVELEMLARELKEHNAAILARTMERKNRQRVYA
jgi:hypothetical protein